MKKKFDIGTLFRDAWKDYKANWKLFILIGIIFFLVAIVSNIGTSFDPVTETFTNSPVIGIIGWLIQMFITLGFIKFLLNMVDGREYKIEDLFGGVNSVQHFVFFVVVNLLYGSLVGIGTILFIVPGIILAIGLLFSQYIIAEEKAGIFESFKESWKITKGNRWKIFWLMIVLAFFNVFGFIAFVVGLAITIPMTYIIYARLYRTFSPKGVSEVESDDEEQIEVEVVEVLEGDSSNKE